MAVGAALALLHNNLAPLRAGNTVAGVHDYPRLPTQPVLRFEELVQVAVHEVLLNNEGKTSDLAALPLECG